MRKGFTIIPNSLLDMTLSMDALALYTWLSLQADDEGVVRTSRALLCEQTGLSERQVRTSLEKLVATKLATKQTTKLPTKFATTITISFLSSCKPQKVKSDQVNDQVNDQVSRVYKNDNIFISSLKEEFKQPPLSPQGGNSSYDWSLLSEPMKLIAMQWLEYKKEKKQTYKPTGFKAFCKRLIKLSGGDPLKAQQIIDYSMSNNYSGIFELNNHATTQTNQQPYHDSDHPTTEQLQQQTAAYIASRLAQD